MGHLKTVAYSAPIGKEETLHQRIFDASQTIRNSSGTLEMMLHSMVGLSVHALIQVEDILSISCEM
jgi:hypothetical protein